MIRIRGARTHNLKNIDLDLPRNKLIIITGLSGSGKSSLAFDTIYAEGQRRYVESLSAYARQFLSLMEKPDVDLIEGLSPAISIEQKSTSHNPRSTVGTVTEIYDYLRLLFARIGEPKCPNHNTTLNAQTINQMVESVLHKYNNQRILLLSPIVQNRKGEFQQLLRELHAQGFLRAMIDGNMIELDKIPLLDKKVKHNIEIVVDRLMVSEDNTQRLNESFEVALNLSQGISKVTLIDSQPDIDDATIFSSEYSCPQCGYNLVELEPRLFSFNNPNGACSECDGLGVKKVFDPEKIIANPSLSINDGAIPGWDKKNFYYYSLISALAEHYKFDLNQPYETLDQNIKDYILYGTGTEKIHTHSKYKSSNKKRHQPFEGIVQNYTRRYNSTESVFSRGRLSNCLSAQPCERCNGERLKKSARHVYISDQNIVQITNLSIRNALFFFENLNLSGAKEEIAKKILEEIKTRLSFLLNVGLDYLSLSRAAETLSGGESQRIRLASQIGSGLVGVMYVLDEPSIGLHQRDNERLIYTLKRMRDLGNTVIVVEHDEDAIRQADYIIDIGPHAGLQGGEVVAAGTIKEIMEAPKSITGQFLNGDETIPINRKSFNQDDLKWFNITEASGNNLQNITAQFPIGLITCVTGVSGSGKSTLINSTLYPAIQKMLGLNQEKAYPYKLIEGIMSFDKIIAIDQSPIGRTPRSNPATYTGLFTYIRDLFSKTKEARVRGYKQGRFSFNVKGGRCEACEGDGLIRVKMHFLPDVYVSCDECKGDRYNPETLFIKYKNKNISDILNMTINEASSFFQAIPSIKSKLDTLILVGLGYICLGQSATTLSGGEAQRMKLSKELSKRDTGNTLYILDEPTTGLHFYDIRQLLSVLHTLRDRGNTIIIIEHNLDVIKTADWIIDLGPEGGDKGGKIIASGTPEDIANTPGSHTGVFLKKIISDQT